MTGNSSENGGAFGPDDPSMTSFFVTLSTGGANVATSSVVTTSIMSTTAMPSSASISSVPSVPTPSAPTPFPLLIVAGASAGGAVLLLVLLVCLCAVTCVVTRKKKHRQKVMLSNFPKFRILDAPNPIYMRSAIPPELTTRDSVETGSKLSSPSREGGHVRPMSSPELVHSGTSSEYSYAVPNEIRVNPSSLPVDCEGYSYAVTSSSAPRKRAASEQLKVPSPYSHPYIANTKMGSTTSSPPVSSPGDFKSATVFPPKSNSFSATESIYMRPATNTESLYAQIKSLKVPHLLRSTITENELLGSGQFGYVMRGSWVPNQGAEPMDIAIKVLKHQSSIMEKIKFLQEAAIMGQFHHSNIVQLYGMVTKGESLMIVLELLPNGDLRNFLVKLRSELSKTPEKSPASQLLGFCREVASGMSYLASMCFVHRDLAARNILLTAENSCKIGDFGMSRDLEDANYYISHGGKIPVKWTAPEALSFHKYSTASDIWSYGVLLYEIWSTGQKPFVGKTNGQTLRLVEGGFRLAPPPGCPRALYQLMIQCWHPESKARPSFPDVVRSLCSPDEELLKWTEEDLSVHHFVATLGVDISIGENLYTDLQMAYV